MLKGVFDRCLESHLLEPSSENPWSPLGCPVLSTAIIYSVHSPPDDFMLHGTKQRSIANLSLRENLLVVICGTKGYFIYLRPSVGQTSRSRRHCRPLVVELREVVLGHITFTTSETEDV